MREDRGIIKWVPFESVVPNKLVIKSILEEKKKVSKPTLSEEEETIIEEKIIDAYYSETIITIYYYKNGFIKNITSKIKKIDQIYKMIYLVNNTRLLFNQILDIETK